MANELATEHQVGDVPTNHSFVVKRVFRENGGEANSS